MNLSNKSDTEIEGQRKIQNTFKKCFANIDTTKSGKTDGCCNFTYKVINNQYVLCINHEGIPIQYDSCIIIEIDSLNGSQLAELLVFDKGQANLSLFCSDIQITNIPKPIRHLYAKSGELIIGFSDTIMIDSWKTYHTTIFIKKLVFKDDKTSKEIIIEKELLWKVLNKGMSG